MSDKDQHIDDFDQNFKNRFEQDGVNPPDGAWNELESKFSQIEDEAFDSAVRKIATEDVTPPEDLWQNINKSTSEESKKKRGVYWVILGVLLGTIGTYLLVLNFDRKSTITEIEKEPVSGLKTQTGTSFVKGNNDKKEISTKLNQRENIALEENQTETIIQSNTAIENNVEQQTDSKSFVNNNPVGSEKTPLANATPSGKSEQNDVATVPSAKIDDNTADPINPKAIKPVTSKTIAYQQVASSPLQDEQKAKPSDKQNAVIDSSPINHSNNDDEPIAKAQDSNSTPHDNQSKTSGNTVAAHDSSKSNVLTQDTANNPVDSNDYIAGDTTDYHQPDSALTVIQPDTLSDSTTVALTDTTKKSKPKKKKKTFKNDSTKKWIVTAYIVPEIQYHNVTKTGSDKHLLDSLLTPNYNVFFEFGASYIIKNQFQIGLGFSMNKYSYDYTKSSIGFKNSLPIENTYPSGVVYIDGLFGSTPTPDLIEIQMAPIGADLNEFLINKEITYNEKLNYTLVNIPFDLKWVPGTWRIKPVIKLGGEINVLVNSSSEVSLTFLQETATTENHAQLRNINFSGSFGLGTQIDLIKGLGITLLPSLNYQSTGISKNSNFQFTPYSIRLYSGLYYKF